MLRPMQDMKRAALTIEVTIREQSSYNRMFEESLSVVTKEEAYLFLELVKKMIDARFVDTPTTVDEIERMVSFEEAGA